MNPRRVALSIAAPAALTLLGVYYWFSGTPYYSLWKVRRAIESRDVDTFEQYVDLEEITNRLVDSAFEELQERNRKKAGKNPFTGLGEALALLMKPTLTEAARNMIRAETTKLIEDGTLGNSSFQSLNIHEIKQEGKIATVTIGRIDRQPLSEDFPDFTFIMRQTRDRTWKVIELSSMNELLRSAMDKPLYTRVRANERNMIGRLRTLNTMLITYWADHPQVGFPRSLEELKGEAVAGANSAYPINEPRGYKYTYSPVLSGGRVISYSIRARPEIHGKTGERSFFTDESGVVRFTREDREASKADPEVR